MTKEQIIKVKDQNFPETKRLWELLRECHEDLVRIGIPVAPIENIYIEFGIPGDRTVSNAWGSCCRVQDFKTFAIMVIPEIMSEDVLETDRKRLIYHELIHTCKGCHRHGKVFFRYANMIREAYNVYIASRPDVLIHKQLPLLDVMICPKCGFEAPIYMNKHKNILRCPYCKGFPELTSTFKSEDGHEPD